jgi:hypothetical protein
MILTKIILPIILKARFMRRPEMETMTSKPAKLNKLGIALFGVIYLLFLYLINPIHRVYSAHGFIQASIFYQILNGNLPPLQPYLAGQPLFYLWGYHFLAVCISKVFNISPFWSFVVINIISLFLAIILSYNISFLLIENSRANILSVIVSIFAITPYPSRIANIIYPSFYVEQRGVPIIQKFSNSNADPIGLVFFLLLLYSLIKIFKKRELGWKSFASLFCSILGIGFFYPPFTLGIISTFLILPFVFISIRHSAKEFINNYLPIYIKVSIIGGLGALLLWPYFSSMSSGLTLHIIVLETLKTKILGFFLLCTPIFLVLFITRNELQKTVDVRSLCILFSVIIGNFLLYISVNQHLGTEYKYLILSTVTLGILGGISFHFLFHRLNRLIVVLLLIIFAFPSFYDLRRKVLINRDIPPTLVEDGKDVLSINKEEQELYRWIRENTNRRSVFIDSKSLIPIFAQRLLFVCPERIDLLGYGLNPLDWFFAGYDRMLIYKRRMLAIAIQFSQYRLTSEDMKNIQEFKDNLYYILRKDSSNRKPELSQWKQVFKTYEGNNIVYKLSVDS